MNVPTEFILGAIIAILGFLVKRQFKEQDEKNAAYDQHLRECNARNERDAGADATTVQRIKTIEENSCQIERKVEWLAVCMERMGTKLNVDLPHRPE